ncbi:MAG: hypothetical protein NDI90_12670 [Nitrospira sp. BO4]|jgi:predicted lactoylglutathione lyase|nr:hypothetical protein [Nitrospira sp. BO4]
MTLLPALGFTRQIDSKGWLQFVAPDTGEFFGVTESALHMPNECPIAIWAESTGEVDRLAKIAIQMAAQHVEGPGYYAVFFEDPSGNRLEICHRAEGVT